MQKFVDCAGTHGSEPRDFAGRRNTPDIFQKILYVLSDVASECSRLRVRQPLLWFCAVISNGAARVAPLAGPHPAVCTDFCQFCASLLKVRTGGNFPVLLVLCAYGFSAATWGRFVLEKLTVVHLVPKMSSLLWVAEASLLFAQDTHVGPPHEPTFQLSSE